MTRDSQHLGAIWFACTAVSTALPISEWHIIMIEGNRYTCHLRRVTGIGTNKWVSKKIMVRSD